MTYSSPYDLPCSRIEMQVVQITFPANASTVFSPIYKGDILRNVAAVIPCHLACGPAAPDGTPFLGIGDSTELTGYYSVFNTNQRPVIKDCPLLLMGLNGFDAKFSVPWMFDRPIDIDLRLSRVQVFRTGAPIERLALAFMYLFA